MTSDIRVKICGLTRPEDVNALTPKLWSATVKREADGVVSVGGQMCNINAYKAGEATVVSSLDFSRLLWATLIGLVLFDQLPGWQTWAGASLVVSAALYTLSREARRGRRLNH